MKIGTKAIVSLLVVTMITLSAVPVSALSATNTTSSNTAERKLERLHKHHDRKMELGASILSMTPDQLRQELKSKSFNQILKEHGFTTKLSYHTALLGKLKDELKRRGWDDKKIQQFLDKRLSRLQHSHNNS
ncbi:MAG TPA: hypothetical protein VH144_00680 [Candidatus Saccharimonadales bacterium]|jgi:hypothetical protein|nr:hypothetical protein [Candidatus Saccharimonadales bacterium]